MPGHGGFGQGGGGAGSAGALGSRSLSVGLEPVLGVAMG